MVNGPTNKINTKMSRAPLSNVDLNANKTRLRPSSKKQKASNTLCKSTIKEVATTRMIPASNCSPMNISNDNENVCNIRKDVQALNFGMSQVKVSSRAQRCVNPLSKSLYLALTLDEDEDVYDNHCCSSNRSIESNMLLEKDVLTIRRMCTEDDDLNVYQDVNTVDVPPMSTLTTSSLNCSHHEPLLRPIALRSNPVPAGFSIDEKGIGASLSLGNRFSSAFS